MTRDLMTAVAAVGLVFGAVGCDSETTPSSPQTTGTTSSQAGHDHDKMAEDQKQIAAGLAKLSPADRALAEKQKVCPVTGEPLGSMGRPEKITVQGKDLFICCKGCRDEVMNHSEKYLTKLGK